MSKKTINFITEKNDFDILNTYLLFKNLLYRQKRKILFFLFYSFKGIVVIYLKYYSSE